MNPFVVPAIVIAFFLILVVVYTIRDENLRRKINMASEKTEKIILVLREYAEHNPELKDILKKYRMD